MPYSAISILSSVINGSFVQQFPDFVDDLEKDVRLQHLVVYQIFKLKKKNPDLAQEMLDMLTETQHASKMSYPYCGVFQLHIEHNDNLKTALHMAVLEEQPLELIEAIKSFGICMTQKADLDDLMNSIDSALSEKWRKEITKIFSKEIKEENKVSLTVTQLAALSNRTDLFEMLTKDTEFNHISELQFFAKLSVNEEKKEYVNLFLSRVNKILDKPEDVKLTAIDVYEDYPNQKINYPFIRVDNKNECFYFYFKAGLECKKFRYENPLKIIYNKLSLIQYPLMCAFLKENFHITLPEIAKIQAKSDFQKTDLVEKGLIDFNLIFGNKFFYFVDLCFKYGFLNRQNRIKLRPSKEWLSPLALAMKLNDMQLVELVLKYQDEITLEDLSERGIHGIKSYRSFFDFLINHDKTNNLLKIFINGDIRDQEKEKAEKEEAIRLAKERQKIASEKIKLAQERKKADRDAKLKQEAEQLEKKAVGSVPELSLSQSRTHSVSNITHQYGSAYPDTSPILQKPLLSDNKKTDSVKNIKSNKNKSKLWFA
jgi:hypothetical protein